MGPKQHETVVQLDGCCIQTAAKRAYEDLLARALDEDLSDAAVDKIETQFELLRGFLEYTDLAGLRASDPDLDGRKKLRVRIWRDDGGFHIRKLG